MPTTPIQQLPRAAADAPHIMVRYIGPFTTDEIARKKKSFDVRKDTVVQFDAFLRQHNTLPAYSRAANQDAIDALPTVGRAAGVHVEILAAVEQSSMNVQQREALERDQLGLDVDAERQHRTVMTSTSAAGGADAQLQRAVNILVRRGTTIAASGFDSKVLESTFSDLFPFGRGGPTETRAAKVGFERCVAHYLALSSHVFGRHATFVLVAKDITGRVAMMSNVSLRVHLDPNMTGEISRLTRAQADAAFEQEKQRRIRRSLLDRVAGIVPCRRRSSFASSARATQRSSWTRT
jgi:hypothetical protein